MLAHGAPGMTVLDTAVRAGRWDAVQRVLVIFDKYLEGEKVSKQLAGVFSGAAFSACRQLEGRAFGKVHTRRGLL